MKAHSQPKLSRILALLGTLVFLGVGPAAVADADAQTRLIPRFPDATIRAMQGSEGASWDLIRQNGLLLTVEGKGEFDLVMSAFAVEHGRVTKRWNSRSRLTVHAGQNKIPGAQFMPGDEYSPGGTFRSDQDFLAGDGFVSATDAQAAYESNSVSVFLDRQRAKDATGVLLVAMPAAGRSGRTPRDVETRPVAAMPKRFGD